MQTKTTFKRLLAIVLMFSLTIFLNPKLSSAKPKLSKKSITVTVGYTQYIYVKGASKKVEWHSSNTRIATVKKGTVKGIHAGKCKILAKVGKKMLKCKVKVKAKKGNINTNPQASAAPVQSPGAGTNTNTISNSVLASNMKVNATPLYRSGCVLLTITNGNAVAVQHYTISYQFCDTAGVAVNSGTTSAYCIPASGTAYRRVYLGIEKALKVDPARSTLSITADNETYINSLYPNGFYTDITSSISVTGTVSAAGDKISTTIKNNATKKSTVNVQVLFYDATNNLIAAEETTSYVDAGATGFSDINIPYDRNESGEYIMDASRNYVRLPYAKYEIKYDARCDSDKAVG